jgi:hypothetical protein
MALFEVSYDLRKPGRNYQGLYDRLAAWGAFRVLESVWMAGNQISTTPSPKTAHSRRGRIRCGALP